MTMRVRARRDSGAGCACLGIGRTIPCPRPLRGENRLPDAFRHRILLLGNPTCRPEGLERVLVRGGFQVTETATGTAPDFLLYTPDPNLANLADEVRALTKRSDYGGAPVFVLLPAGSSGAATEALLAGARDALAGAVHLPELRARLDAHIRERAEAREAQDALRAR